MSASKTYTWTTTGTANWNTGADWNNGTATGTVANGANNAVINQGGVTLTSNQTINLLNVGGGSLFLNNAGQTLNVLATTTLSSGAININAAATLLSPNFNQTGGTFSMNAGTLTANTAADFNGGTATLSAGNLNGARSPSMAAR